MLAACGPADPHIVPTGPFGLDTTGLSSDQAAALWSYAPAIAARFDQLAIWAPLSPFVRPGANVEGSHILGSKRLPHYETLQTPENASFQSLPPFAGWRVRVHPTDTNDGSWEYQPDRWVYGVTWCEDRLIELTDRNWPISATAHELAHALQMCDAHPPEGCTGPRLCDHYDWEATGINAAVADLKAWRLDEQ